MADSPLYLVVGWDPSAAQAVKSLVALGMTVTVVVPVVPDGVPSEARVVTGATFDIETLRAAGADHAAGLLSALPADEARRAVSAARSLNPTIHIVASLQDGESKASLWMAGVGDVVDAKQEAGRKMVRVMFEPENSDNGDDKIRWARVPVPPGSPWVGLRLTDLRGRVSNAAIACLWPGGSPDRSRDDDDARVAEGDVLIVLGARAELESLFRSSGFKRD